MGNKFIMLLVCMLIPFSVHAQGEAYTDTTHGFSVTIPPGWQVDTQKDDALVLVLNKIGVTQPFKPSIVVNLVDDVIQMPSTKSQLKTIVKQIAAPAANVPNIGNYRVTGSALDSRKGDSAFYYKTAYELLKIEVANQNKVLTLNYVFRDKGRYVAMALIVPAAEYKEDEEMFWKFLASFQLTSGLPQHKLVH